MIRLLSRTSFCLLLATIILPTAPALSQEPPTNLQQAASQAAATLTPAQLAAAQKAAAHPSPTQVRKLTDQLTPEQMAKLQKIADYVTPDMVLTPEQQKIFYELDTSIAPSRALIERAIKSVTKEQWDIIHNFFPGLEMTPDLTNTIVNLVQQVYQIAYNDKLSVTERGHQLKALANQYIDVDKAGLSRTICIWDPIGRAGPIYQAAVEQKARATEFGVNIKLVPYTDEAIALADLKANKCDAALMSGMRTRTLNTFTGTIDAIGAVTTDEQMRTLLFAVSRPLMAKHMVQGPFDILGVAQGGAAYIFVDDKSINTLGKAAGKKVAVLGYDPVQAEMVAAIGATPVPATMISAPGMFNNHVIDVLAAPLVAYNALEFYKGMTPNGGIVNYPLTQITMQLVGWRHKIPNVIGQLIRETFFENYDKINTALNNETRNIPSHWWIDIPEKDKGEYDHMMQQARLVLRDKGYYSGEMLTIQRKIRCKFDPSRGECANPVE